MSEMLYVLAAAFDDVETALVECHALEVAFRHVGTSTDFDATVVAKQPDGKVEIVSRHDEPKRKGPRSGSAGASRPARSARCSTRATRGS